MDRIKSFKNEGEIRLIKTDKEWSQFVEMSIKYFPEFKDIIKKEDLKFHQENNRYLFGYFTNDVLIGSIGIQLVKKQKLGLLGYFQVKEEYRKQGIGKRLLWKTRKLLKQYKCKFIYLWVLSNNKQAISIYKKWGFKQVPMIYNIDKIQINKVLSLKTLIISKKIIVRKKKQVENLITDMFSDYYNFNKVYHTLDDISHFYLQNYVFTREVDRKNQLAILKYTDNKFVIFQLFLLNQRKNSFIALKEELVEIKDLNDAENLKITIYGILNKQEIIEIQELGFEIRFPLAFNAFILEI